MKRLLILILTVTWILTVLPITAQNHNLAGTWVGGYEVDEQWIFMEIQFWRTGDSYQGRIDLAGDLSRWQLLSSVSLDGIGTLSLSWDDITLTGQLVGDEITGEQDAFSLARIIELPIDTYKPYIGNYAFEDGRILMLLSEQNDQFFIYHDTEEQRMVKIYPLSETTFFSEKGEELVIANDERISLTSRDGNTQFAQRVFPYVEEEIRYPHGEITLAGTLLLPKGEGQFPAIVLMHSTGPNNRDFFRQWGHYFAAAGIAALVYDKPGTFDSAHSSVPSPWYNSIQDLADASLAGVGYLQTRPEINAEQIGLWTFSNSSWAGPLAASQSEQVAFIIATAVSGVAGRQADVFQEDLNNIRHYDYPQWAANTSLRYVKFTREFSRFAREWKLPISAPVRDYWGVDFDPLTAWQKVTQPVLVLNGELDTLVDPVDAVARIQATLEDVGHTDYTLIIVPDADHRLQLGETGLIDESRGRRDLVFAPDIIETMTRWVLARFDGTTKITLTNIIVTSPVTVAISPYFEDGGRYDLLPWYGQPETQTPLLMILLLVPFGVVVGWPLKDIVRRVRGSPPPETIPLARPVAGVMTLLMLLVVAGMVMTWVQIAHMYIGELWGFPAYLNIVPVLAYMSIPAVLATAYFAVQMWRGDVGTVGARLRYSLIAASGFLFILFIISWCVIG